MRYQAEILLVSALSMIFLHKTLLGRMFKPFISFVVMLGLGITTSFAQWTDYTWGDYGLQFSIPNTHTVKRNKADAFESGDNTTWIELYPYDDISETPEDMIRNVAERSRFSIEEEGEYNSGGWEGYWVQCASDQHPEWKYWLIGFVDPESESNFYAIIWWKKGNDAAYNIANEMSYKFEKL